jgi:hypothetical protein
MDSIDFNQPPLYDRPPMYDMPPVYDHSERKVEKVSTLKSFLKSCLELMKDETAFEHVAWDD